MSLQETMGWAGGLWGRMLAPLGMLLGLTSLGFTISENGLAVLATGAGVAGLVWGMVWLGFQMEKEG
jgi:hypothetical protein